LFPLLYVLFLAGTLLALSLRADRTDIREQNAFRVVLAGFALLFAGVGVVGLVGTQDNGAHSLATAPTGYLVFGALTLGGSLHLIGIIAWRGRHGFALRFGGWALMTLALMTPSTLTLALPLLSVLAVAFRTFVTDTGAAASDQREGTRSPWSSSTRTGPSLPHPHDRRT